MSFNSGGALSGAAAGASAGAAAGPYGAAAGAVIGGVLGATGGGGGASTSPAGPSNSGSWFGGAIFQDGSFTVGDGNSIEAPQTAVPQQPPAQNLGFGLPFTSGGGGGLSSSWLIIGGLALVAVLVLRRRGAL